MKVMHDRRIIYDVAVLDALVVNECMQMAECVHELQLRLVRDRLDETDSRRLL